MLTTNLTSLIANITNAGFRFEGSNPIAVESYLLDALRNPAFMGATFNVTFEGQPHKMYLGLIENQGWYSQMNHDDNALE